MNPLRDLKKSILDSSFVDTGTVVGVTVTAISVRTREGIKSFSVPNANMYRAGDAVRFQGNILLGKSVSADNLPVFEV